MQKSKFKIKKSNAKWLTAKNFNSWLEDQTEKCIKDLERNRNKAKELLRKIFRYSKNRLKRNIFGDGLAFLTGLESLSQSQHMREATIEMQKILKGK